MARRVPLIASRRGLSEGWAFCLVAAFMALDSLVLRGTADLELDWQPGLAASQPWRWWTAAFVHYSPLHLLANLAGVALVGALGFVTRVPTRVAVGWLVAWPLTHLLLLTMSWSQSQLSHYGGLSGVLHAGVALVAIHAIAQGPWPRQRWLGAAILIGVTVKVLMEAPWRSAVQYRPGWDIAIAPAAHLTGLVAGIAVGLVLEASSQRRMRRTRAVVE